MILLLLNPAVLSAQFPNFHDISYFSDSEKKFADLILSTVQVDDGIMVAHIQQNKGFGVLKMDFSGNTVWTTNYRNPNYYHKLSSFQIALMSDGFLYGLSTGGYTAYDPNPELSTLWKIDTASGKVHWVRDFNSKRPFRVKFDEVNDSTLALMYYEGDVAILSTVNKQNGNWQSKVPLDTLAGWDELALASDAEGTLFASAANSIWCFRANDLSSSYWTRTYPEVDHFQKLYVDSRDSLYLIADYERYHNIWLIRASKTSGTEQSKTLITQDRTVDRLLETDSSLFLITTSGASSVVTVKFNKRTDQITWTAPESLAPQGSTATGERVTGAALDANGDVLICGFHGAYIVGLSVCSFMKLSGTNGKKLNRKTVSWYNGEKDVNSKSMHIGVHKGSLLLLAQLDLSDEIYNSYFLKFNPNSWEQQFDQRLRTSHIAPSKTIDIKREKNQMIVFKQKGARVQLEAYNLSGTPDWSRDCAQSYFTQGGVMLVHEGYAYIACTNYEEHALIKYNSDPSVSDPPAFLQLSKIDLRNGGLVASDTFHTAQESLNAVQMLVMGTTIYLLVEEHGFLEIRSWQGSGFTGRIRLDNWSYMGRQRSPENYSGKRNIMVAYENDLYLVGGSALFRIKGNLSNFIHLELYSNGKQHNQFYDLLLDGPLLFACGSSREGKASILGYNLADEKFLFEKYLSEADTFTCMRRYGDSVLISGQSAGKAVIYSFTYPDFRYKWSSFYRNIAANTQINDLEVFPEKELIVWAGQRQYPDHTCDGLIGFMKLNGDTISITPFADSLMGQSGIGVLERSNDSTLWLGGAHNRKNVNEGLIGQITLDTTFRSVIKDTTQTGSIPALDLNALIYPNPCRNHIYYRTGSNPIQKIQMYSLDGRRWILPGAHTGRGR